MSGQQAERDEQGEKGETHALHHSLISNFQRIRG
jgi:hypothetical protein